MVDILLTDPQKRRLSEWRYRSQGRTLTDVVFGPLWDVLVRLVPATVAPNVLTLAGLLCVLPRGIDGRHARATRNDSPLGELFDYACANLGGIFLALTLAYVAGVTQTSTLWYMSQAFGLAYLLWHLRGLATGTLHWGFTTGPGEALFAIIAFVATRAIVGVDAVAAAWSHAVDAVLVPSINAVAHWAATVDISVAVGATKVAYVEAARLRALELLQDTDALLEAVAFGVYVVLVVSVAVYAVLAIPSERSATRNGMLLCLLYGALMPSLHSWLNASLFIEPGDVSLHAIIFDGAMLSVLTTDVVVAKMAGRDLHPWVVVFFMVGSFDHFVCGALAGAYFVLIFWEVCEATHLPMFTTVINVYVDGVYDLMHYGHLRVLRAALSFGSHLIVGVVGDASVNQYKHRTPVMSLDERVSAVRASGLATRVIPDSPCFGLSEEFILENHIHLVVHSVEYETEDDIYYRVPRAMGITRVLPRTEGISTSELIRRIRTRDDL
ncbi:cholinephosphotransferase 1 [Thecamonas trahens ATCC 50062]|uniref:ethanolamine-phosphate cytidylyltransferase n=1 Tax=Thecamonas trahens ATCC 50062 TaxID=461836 RepID=A0A0L0DMR5_THETB|nr:cholinephosphotransferase 1 [Thecamonas trahens ATCC 50062]KNC53331.1 cholinephosphotransferase 1 [Thecamonas trahens ATCC 50062]|eukprot:XP_013754587.1 cholinephosphotransferase 1 [Thecamonas trahens ATCC 50062]